MKAMKMILFGAVAVMLASCSGPKTETKADTDTAAEDSQVVGFIEEMPDTDTSAVISTGDGVAVD